MPMRIRRRIGTAGAPAGGDLVEGQLGYHQFGGADALYIGDGTGAPLLVGAGRQVELQGNQTISGQKTIAVSALKITGATAANQVLTVSNIANGDLAWATVTGGGGGGLTSVAVDGVTISGDGDTNPLQVISVPLRNITITTRPAQPDGSITTINVTPAAYDATGNVAISNFAITRIDDGTY